jgi:hypothetical protein
MLDCRQLERDSGVQRQIIVDLANESPADDETLMSPTGFEPVLPT